MKKESLKNLSKDEIKRGIFLVLDNAEELLLEAILLGENDRLSRSYTLAQLAGEEVGKSFLLAGILAGLDQAKQLDWDELDKFYFSHSEKTRSSIVIQFLFEMLYLKHGMDNRTNYFKDLTEKRLSKVNSLNNFKNDSLYVGIKENRFVAPKEIIDEDLLNALIEELLSKYIGSRVLFSKMFNNIDVKDHRKHEQEIFKSHGVEYRLQKIYFLTYFSPLQTYFLICNHRTVSKSTLITTQFSLLHLRKEGQGLCRKLFESLRYLSSPSCE